MAGEGGGAIGLGRQWLGGLIMLGALYLVATHGAGVATALKAGGGFLATSEGTVLRGGK
jgi:hypothetical protein